MATRIVSEGTPQEAERRQEKKMKRLETRQELAQYLNVKKVACVSINLDDMTKDGEGYYAKGTEVRCSYQTRNGDNLRTKGYVYTDNGRWFISGSGSVLHSGERIYTTEALEMAKWANAPTVKEGDEIVVLAYLGEATFPMVMTVGRLDVHCSTVCELF